jgi:single-stranded-DNA-specific exonuclease
LRPLTEALLDGRGYGDRPARQDFLTRRSLSDLAEFWRLPDMAKGVAILREAILAQKRIWIYGDYDADGITATALLVKALAFLGVEAGYYLPSRLNDGYGLHKDAIDLIKGQGAELLVTVDCGISGREEAAYAQSLDLPMLITDHHRPPAELPAALALINPELMAEPGPNRGLAGAGVAFALAACLLEDFDEGAAGSGKQAEDFDKRARLPEGFDEGAESSGKRGRLQGDIDRQTCLEDLAALAALGTMADGMPLQGNNRILVAAGLAGMASHPSPGLRALLSVGGLTDKPLEAGQLSYVLAPRLNAPGRMGDPALGLRLLLTEDPAVAAGLAEELEAANRRRQETEAAIGAAALAELERAPERLSQPVLLVAGEGWHPGVIGIVAARLVERFNKPALVVSLTAGEGRGSGRSLPGLDLYAALSAGAGLFSSCGGHAMACGFSIPAANLPALAEHLRVFALERWTAAMGEESVKVYQGDLIVQPGQLTDAGVAELDLLAPFGPENPRPLLQLSRAKLREIRPIGQDGKHYKLFFAPGQPFPGWERLSEREKELTAVAFRLEDNMIYPQAGEFYDLLFTPEINIWRGRRTVSLILRDLRPAAGEGPAGGGPGEPVADEVAGADRWEAYRPAILGGEAFRAKQREALDSLAAGHNTLLIMATGRGKTAVFQTAAAALGREGITVIIYPLRSLAREQKLRMEQRLAPLGLSVFLAWGGLEHWAKKTFFSDLRRGRYQLIITTAEFLQAHLDSFLPIRERLSLFVADEAHHLGVSHRQGYKNLRQTWEALGRPLFLGTTATADSLIAGRISRDFGIERLVAEEHCRENLSVVDSRGREDKLAYILAHVRPDSKLVVYVNSRRLAEDLAAELRASLPELAAKIGFYHGGLLSEERRVIESDFRAGAYSLLVSTNAFGEGADIPDIRDIMLYHLCFSRTEYNQLSGRAGRDGKPARIHLLYGGKDQELNRLLLTQEAPGREVLGAVYLFLREKAAVANPLLLSDETLAAALVERGFAGLTAQGVAHCLGVLEELALLLREWAGDIRYIHLAPPPPAKLDLNQSSLYKESQEARRLYEEYLPLAFSRDSGQLLAGVNRPIMPERRRTG